MDAIHVSSWRGAASVASFAHPEHIQTESAVPESPGGNRVDDGANFHDPEGGVRPKEPNVRTKKFDLVDITGEVMWSSDFRFDPNLQFAKRGQSDAVREWLRPLIDKQMQRERGVRDRDDFFYGLILRLIVANALKASVRRTSRSVHYSRRQATYATGSPYMPRWIGFKMLRRTIDLLGELGFLTVTRGTVGTIGVRRQSTFEATESLIAGLSERGIAPDHVERQTGAFVTVVLKDANKHRQFYDPHTAEVAPMIKAGRAYNRFLKAQTIELQLTDDEWRQFWEDIAANREKYAEPDFNAVELYRVFSNSSWNQCGRFFGGWWQVIPSEWRDKIILNGEPTVELDYSGFGTRAAYHHLRLPYTDDPYDIPAIKIAAQWQAMEWEPVRDSIKTMSSVLLNASPEDRVNGITGLTLPKGITKKAAFAAIEAHHSPIAGLYRKGWGLELMRNESDICARILAEGMEVGVPVLPIHDSYRVPSSNEAWLRAVMEQRYRRSFGMDPIIH